jgi:hypothetical protein
MKKEDLIVGQVYVIPPLEVKFIGFAAEGHEVILQPMNNTAKTKIPLYTAEDEEKDLDKPAGCFRVATWFFIGKLKTQGN